MSVPFEEQLIRRNQNADLIMQPEDDRFRRRAPLIEEESIAGDSDAAPFSMSMEPARARSRALAQKIIKNQDVKAKPDTGWKLFSPSTWGIFRNTDWGRKKAVKRQLKSMTSRMNSLGTAVKSLDPRSGFFSNASWDDRGSGPRGMTASQARPDANLETSAAYGMSKGTADAWGAWVDAQTALATAQDNQQMGAAYLADRKAKRQLEGRQSWKDMWREDDQSEAGESDDHDDDADESSASAIPMEPDLREGDIVDGHALLGPGSRQEGDALPDIVAEVFGRGAGGRGPRAREFGELRQEQPELTDLMEHRL